MDRLTLLLLWCTTVAPLPWLQRIRDTVDSLALWAVGLEPDWLTVLAVTMMMICLID